MRFTGRHKVCVEHRRFVPLFSLSRCDNVHVMYEPFGRSPFPCLRGALKWILRMPVHGSTGLWISEIKTSKVSLPWIFRWELSCESGINRSIKKKRCISGEHYNYALFAHSKHFYLLFFFPLSLSRSFALSFAVILFHSIELATMVENFNARLLGERTNCKTVFKL